MVRSATLTGEGLRPIEFINVVLKTSFGLELLSANLAFECLVAMDQACVLPDLLLQSKRCPAYLVHLYLGPHGNCTCNT